LIFAAAVFVLLGLLWYFLHIEPAGHPDYSMLRELAVPAA